MLAPFVVRGRGGRNGQVSRIGGEIATQLLQRPCRGRPNLFGRLGSSANHWSVSLHACLAGFQELAGGDLAGSSTPELSWGCIGTLEGPQRLRGAVHDGSAAPLSRGRLWTSLQYVAPSKLTRFLGPWEPWRRASAWTRLRAPYGARRTPTRSRQHPIRFSDRDSAQRGGPASNFGGRRKDCALRRGSSRPLSRAQLRL